MSNPGYAIGKAASAAAAAGAAFFSFNTTTRRAKISKFLMTNPSSLPATVGLYRASNVPVATGASTPQALDPADPVSLASYAAAWSTPPTVGATAIYEIVIPAAIGGGVQEPWQTGKEIVLALATWLVGWNDGAVAGPALAVSIFHDE